MAIVIVHFIMKVTSHALTRSCELAWTDSKELECPITLRNDSDQSSLYSKPPDMRSVGDTALNPSLRKSKHFLQYRINSSCKLILSMYTFNILTMRLSA